VSQASDTDRQEAVEQWVISACAKLGLPVATSDDDFFEAGGTSLAVIRIIARADEEFGAEALSPEELIEQSTVRQIAATILGNTTIGTVPSATEH
jgi:acyl carrier protein